MAELIREQSLEFSNIQEFIHHFKLKRLFSKLENCDIDNFVNPIEDIILIHKYMKLKFKDDLWCMDYIPEIDKIKVIIF